MKTWIKRYVIILLCILMASAPVLLVFKQYDIINTDENRIIFWSIYGSIILIILLIMTILMIRGTKKRNKKK